MAKTFSGTVTDEMIQEICDTEENGTTELIFEAGTIIEDYACQNVYGLRKLTFLGKVTVGEGAFHHCKDLAEIEGSEYIEEFLGAVFCGCVSLKSIKFGKNVKRICNNAFTDTGITFLDLSDVKGIEESAFSNCKHLEKVILPKDMTSIPSFLFNCAKKLSEVTIPDGVVTIEPYGFYGSGITNINIPSSMKAIYKHAFAYTKLSTFDLSNAINLECIGCNVVDGTNVKEVDLTNTGVTYKYDDGAFGKNKLTEEKIKIINSFYASGDSLNVPEDEY